MELVVLSTLFLSSLGSRWVHLSPRRLDSRSCCFVITLLNNLTPSFFFFPLCTVVVTLFDLSFFGSCIIPFFHTTSATKDLALKMSHQPVYPLARCCLLSDWMEREYCTFSSMQLSLSPYVIPIHGSEGYHCGSGWCGAGPDWTKLWEDSMGRGVCSKSARHWLTHFLIHSCYCKFSLSYKKV